MDFIINLIKGLFLKFQNSGLKNIITYFTIYFCFHDVIIAHFIQHPWISFGVTILILTCVLFLNCVAISYPFILKKINALIGIGLMGLSYPIVNQFMINLSILDSDKNSIFKCLAMAIYPHNLYYFGGIFILILCFHLINLNAKDS